MDPPPATDVDHILEKIEDGKEEGPFFHCDLYDTEVVRKIAQAFIPGLATACVDNTTGDIFRSPGSVAADIRKEMIDYLTQRSETFVAEHVVLDGGLEQEDSDNPHDIISDFIDDFATSKRNLFSRVSGWLLSERREDNIDDFAQEMEINGFWLMDRREAMAQTLLKNVDFKNTFHCEMKFKSEEELAEHVENCWWRSVNCENEGCTTTFSASQMEKHDSVCPFKIIPCEQNCSDSIMRREMDRHCITVCPMKLVNCPFYAVGCQSAVPQYQLEQHRSDDLDSHLMYILRNIHKEASGDDLKLRIEQIQQLSNRVAESRDARSLTYLVKDLDAKLGPLEIKANVKEEKTETMNPTAGSPEKIIESEVEVTEQYSEKESETTDFIAGALEETERKVIEVEVKDKVDEEGTKTMEDAERKVLEVEVKENVSEEGSKTMNSKFQVPDEAEAKVPELEVKDKAGEEGTEAKNSTAHVLEEAETKAPEVQVMDKVDEEGMETKNSADHSLEEAENKAQIS